MFSPMRTITEGIISIGLALNSSETADRLSWTTTCKWFRGTCFIQSQRWVNKRITDMHADTKMLNLNRLAAYIILLESLRAIPHLSPLPNEVRHSQERHSLFVRAVSKMQIRENSEKRSQNDSQGTTAVVTFIFTYVFCFFTIIPISLVT